MLYREIIAVCSANCTKRKCPQWARCRVFEC